MHSPSTDGRKSRPGSLLAIIVGLCLVAGLAAWHFLSEAMSVPLSSPPPERQGLNAPFVMTPDVVVDKMVELADLEENDTVYDLGCGEGRLVITAAMKSGCKGVGFDIDPDRVAEARENAKLHEVDDRVEIREQDVFTVDLGEADVVLMYLLPWMVNKLLPQFQEMRDGCRIVTHDFWIDGVEPDKYIELVEEETGKMAGIYVYDTPLKINPAMEKGKPPRPADGRTETLSVQFPKGAYRVEER